MPRVSTIARRPEFVLAVLAVGLGGWAAGDWYWAEPVTALRAAKYVGRASCIQCHQAEAAAFHGSHHDRAMEIATDESVLGDFDDAVYERLGERTRFFRDGEKFMVNAEGPDGDYRNYEVKWTFGVHPLQQYMVEFPDGRVQVLRVSWDARKNEWFFVPPPDAPDERIEAGSPLHWTGLAQNWNSMCAECHSTDYHKNFDLASNTYKHDFKEIDVSCEACHGPGSVHVDLARRSTLFWDRNVRYGLVNTLKNSDAVHQAETCAPCHSRRAFVHGDYRAGDSFYDHFDPVLLHNGLYFSDGQIEDEVYEFGSFTQSKMYHKDVRCTDCHNPHSLELKYPGNELCAQCHQPGKYDGVVHHRHADAKEGSPETQCVSCHMPTRTYMAIDDRRDHSIRIPRPDLTVSLGTPNACQSCHTSEEEDAEWAAAAVVRWYGDERPGDAPYAPALEAAQLGLPQGEDLLAELLSRRELPEIVRATAVSLLPIYPTEDSRELQHEALEHESPLVRAAAVRQLSATSATALLRDVRPLLSDPVRIVRMAATARLVASAAAIDDTEFRDALTDVAADYRAAQALNLDRVEAHLSLASLAEQLDDVEGAIASFRNAIRVEPYRAGPRRELARLLALVAATPAHAALREKLEVNEAEIRRLRVQEADLLARDAKLLPGNPEPHYVRGLLFYQLGQFDDARLALEEACRLAPTFYDAWMALAEICGALGRWEDAARAVEAMRALQPHDPNLRDLVIRLNNAALASKAAEEEAAAAPHSESLSPDEADDPGADEAATDEPADDAP
jgi:tetratricopeptide (TPR) repeat protein